MSSTSTRFHSDVLIVTAHISDYGVSKVGWGLDEGVW